MQKIYLYVVLIMLIGGTVSAQDIHFSQFYQAPLHLNPALTGVMECTQRFTANYRNQWSSVLSNEFQTYSASYDRKIASGRRDYFGIGGSLWGDRVGSANFATYSARLSGSYSRFMGGGRNESHYLAVGADIGVVNRSINIAKLLWGTQHDGMGRGNPELPSLEEGNFADDNFTYADLSVGALWFSTLANDVSWYLGAAASHINRPGQSFFDDDEVQLYTKYTIHGGAEFGFQNNFAILPGFVTFFQGPSFQLNAGASGRIYLDGTGYSSESFQLGVWGRLVNNYEWGDNQLQPTEDSSLGLDAVILSARFDYDKFGIGFSYDINVSDLKNASNSRGAFEFSLIYNICGNETRGVYCPKF